VQKPHLRYLAVASRLHHLTALAGRFRGCPGSMSNVQGYLSIPRYQLTLSRYSTARSGLKNAALIARSISALGKPILSIFETAASR
jgi:hypothetical protein